MPARQRLTPIRDRPAELPDRGHLRPGQVAQVYPGNADSNFHPMQVYHTQELLNELPEPQLNEFQKWLVGALEGYKVLALNCTSGRVF